jgi:hypothetical protein
MAPRRAKKRSRSPSQKRRGDQAEDFDLPPPLERVPFSAPWPGAPKDEFSVTAHAWPIQLFEAFYGVLWKAVSKKDPKWARRFDKLLLYAFAVMSRREAFQLDHAWQRTMPHVA